MVVPLLLLAGAAVLGWLSAFDRTSTVAVSVVEVESQFGLPLWAPFAVAGIALVIVHLARAKPPPPAPRRPPTRDAGWGAPDRALAEGGGAAATAAVVESGGWLAAVRAGARGVSDDAMGRVRFGDADGVPIALVLTGVTREQARRRVAAYAAWLATIPPPPVARVRVVSSPDVGGPIAVVLRGEIAKYLPGDAAHVVATHEGADVVFASPDPRWRG